MNPTAYEPLAFVQIKIFGENIFLTQVSPNPDYLILSSYYSLTPILASPKIIHAFIGSQADLISLNKDAYAQLIKEIATSSNDRIQTNDPLLLARAFWFLNTKFNFSANPSVQVTKNDIVEAIESSIESDDLIKDVHYNLVSAFAEKQKQLAE